MICFGQKVLNNLPDSLLPFINTVILQFKIIVCQFSSFLSALLKMLLTDVIARLQRVLMYILNYRFFVLLFLEILHFFICLFKVLALLVCIGSPLIILGPYFCSVESIKETTKSFYKDVLLRKTKEFKECESLLEKIYMVISHLFILATIYATFTNLTKILQSSFSKAYLKT